MAWTQTTEEKVSRFLSATKPVLLEHLTPSSVFESSVGTTQVASLKSVKRVLVDHRLWGKGTLSSRNLRIIYYTYTIKFYIIYIYIYTYIFNHIYIYMLHNIDID